MITQEELKLSLHYDANTGLFIRLKTTSSNGKLGDVIGIYGNSNGYVLINVNKKRYLAHRLAWLYVYGNFPKDMIDHIDGNSSNNKIENLREANSSQNQQNQKTGQIGSKTGILGVCQIKKTGKFQASIKTIEKLKYLGVFDTLEEAQKCYLNAKRKYHEFCTI